MSTVGEKKPTEAGKIDLTNQEREKSSTSQQRGQEKRKQSCNSFKAEIINEMDNGEKAERLTIKCRINRSLAVKQFKDRIKIMKIVLSEHKKHLKIRPVRQYLALYDSLLRVFKTTRSKGYHVDFDWLWSKTRVLYREMTSVPEVIVHKHMIVNFIKRNNIRMRARQRNRNKSKESFKEPLKQ